MTAVTETPGRYKRPLLHLIFSDSEFEGLLVTCRRPSVGETLAIKAANTSATSELEGLIALLAGEYGDPDRDLGPVITSWNLDDHMGRPIPITVAGLRGVDPDLIATISVQLVKGATGVSRPLSPASSGGDPSLEASMPMEPLSDSPPSTDAPG